MKHQIDTMTSINNLVKGYENTIGMLRIQNEQLRIDLDELRKENLFLRTELSEITKKRKKKK
jgi:regulator of replication initiation timing